MRAIGNLIVFAIYAIIMIVSIIGIPILALHLFFMFGRANKSAENANQKLIDSMMDGESIISSSIEMRPYALFTRRSIIGITKVTRKKYPPIIKIWSNLNPNVVYHNVVYTAFCDQTTS